MLQSKEIASIEVINAGSPPDVDSDFNTKHRESAIEHVTDVYGEVANIITFSAYQAKGAFKALCTIYQVPFSNANKAAELIPVGCKFNDMFDPASGFYEQGAEFRAFTSGEEWSKIVEGARAIEGRYFTTGMHAAGVVISPTELAEVIPLHVRQTDQRIMSQWEYAELEELGLIKMDFLGLDTVDLIQHTIENIQDLRGNAPNMLDFIHGEMNDEKTFELLGRGETIGIFQLSSDGMRDLLLRMKPTHIDDISAITALFRPGPMGMDSHIKYADRKNGREKVDYIHPDFNGSALEDILGKTYGLCIPKGTPVYDTTAGCFIPIEEMKPGISQTPSLNHSTKNIESKVVENVVPTGVKPIYCITLDNGRSIRVSDTHPVLTRRGYVPARDLSVSGDQVCYTDMPYSRSFNSRVRHTEMLRTWVEYGEACSVGRSSVSLSSLVKFSPSQILAFFAGWMFSQTEDFSYTTRTPEDFTGFTQALLKVGIAYTESHSDGEHTLRVSPWEIKNYILPYHPEWKTPVVQQKISTPKYSRITHIRVEGEQECFDIEVADNHNFLLQGCVVHNCVYQEQVMQIANQIAGMSLQDGDKLRKAMGKKKFDVMEKMKPIFYEGAQKNGFSTEAITRLWDTIEVFAAYGFNKAHAVAYAVMSMQTAYLKAHYPSEFLAALINQNIGNPDKISAFLQEANRMGVRVGTVSINRSTHKITPLLDDENLDIVYGLNGVRAVSEQTARLITQEREKNGEFSSLSNFVSRCVGIGVSNKTILQNLAKAGAFDELGVTRKGAVDAIPEMLQDSRKSKNKGSTSLFAGFGSSEEQSGVDIPVSSEEFSHVERLREEAHAIGLYISEHPLEKCNNSLFSSGCHKISAVLKSTTRKTVRVCGVIANLDIKSKKNGKTVFVNIDDGSGYLRARLSRDLVEKNSKMDALSTIKKRFLDGRDTISDDVVVRAKKKNVIPKDSVIEYGVYVFDVKIIPQPNGEVIGIVEDYMPLNLTHSGELPLRLRVPKNVKNVDATLRKLPVALGKHFTGDTPIVATVCDWDNLTVERPREEVYLRAVEDIHDKVKERNWDKNDTVRIPARTFAEKCEAVDALPYMNTGVRALFGQDTYLGAEKYVGANGFDYGVINPENFDV